MENITSPFANNLSKNYLSLTSTEIGICNMIEKGLQTKEIAQIRGVSEGTVNRHRENIRRKLKIKHSDTNLMTFLQSGMWKKEISLEQ
jgi:DNA-binding CsgD family transcriptional regulator